MTPAHVLLAAAGVILAIILAFAALGTGISILDHLQAGLVRKSGWFVAAAVVLWVLWELAPGSHAVLLRLWADLQRQAGEVVKGVKGVL